MAGYCHLSQAIDHRNGGLPELWIQDVKYCWSWERMIPTILIPTNNNQS